MKHRLIADYQVVTLSGFIFAGLASAAISIFYCYANVAIVAIALAAVCAFGLVFYLLSQLGGVRRTIVAISLGEDLDFSEIRTSGLTKAAVDGLATIDGKVKEASTIISSMANGESDQIEAKILSESDCLFKSITTLHQQLYDRNFERQKRQWVNEGLAKFSDLIRSNAEDINSFSDQIIKNVVKYIGCNQGAFFTLTEDEENNEVLELTGCYAYERKKFVSKRIAPGQGILGQCMLEKDLIYLKEIPEDYVAITSGLGEAPPTNIIIVPLINKDEFYGAIELASFHLIEDFKVDFIKRLAESIAQVLHAININTHTQKLLQQSQKLAEELRTRETDMQVKVEELELAHVEMESKQNELDGIVSSINATMVLMEFDIQGNLLNVNDQFLKLADATRDKLIGKNFNRIFTANNSSNGFWTGLEAAASLVDDFQSLNSSQREIWLHASLTPIKDKAGKLTKVLLLGMNVTEQKLVLEKLSLVADNTDNAVIITNTHNHIEYVNPGFTKLSGYQLTDCLGKRPTEILSGPETNKATIERVRENISRGLPVNEEILNYDKEGNTYWVSMVVNPVTNRLGKIERYISVQTDITDTKKNALDFSNKLEAINTSNLIIEFDMEGKVLNANDNFLNVTGYIANEIIGMHHTMLLKGEEHQTEQYTRFWDNLKKGEFAKGEFLFLGKDRKEIWLRGIYNPIHDINNRFYKVMHFAVDITAEKKLEIENVKRKREIDGYLEAIDKTVASVEFNITGQIMSANDIFLGVMGFKKSEIMGKRYDLFVPPGRNYLEQANMMWQSLKNGKSFTGEFRRLDKHGNEHWLYGTYNPILDVNGKPRKVKLLAQFVTKDKEKQIELSGTVNALKMSAPVFELKPDGYFKSGNELFFKEFGLKRLELRNKRLGDIFNNEARVNECEKIIINFKKGDFKETELIFQGDSKQLKVYKATFSPVVDLKDEVIKIVGILFETTAELQLTNLTDN